MRVRLRPWRRDKPVSGSATLDAVRDAYRVPAEPTVPVPADPRCTETTRAGTRCKNDAVADGRCRVHPLPKLP